MATHDDYRKSNYSKEESRHKAKGHKKEHEDVRRQKEAEDAANVYEEFIATFQETPVKHKYWIKAGTFNAGSREEDEKEKGKIYKPTSKLQELAEQFSSAEKALEHAKKTGDRPDKPGKKKEKEKKKSNLELFKEELKLMQEERTERHRMKNVMKGGIPSKQTRLEPLEPTRNMVLTVLDRQNSMLGSYDNGDPHTTNLYLGNLSPKITEQQLMELFGRFGPLASIKIMWPRSDEEKARGRNCGFVAFMNRRDGDRALKSLSGKEVMGYEMKLGWGKAVPIPPQPIYIPPAMLEMTLPPLPSGLPFNAQWHKKDRHKAPALGKSFKIRNEEDEAEFDKILSRAVVKVVIPTERNLLALIHRMIEFVVREGPMFEAMIMNREISNPIFRFLFDNQSPANVYYRWKLFSILQGDTPQKWCTQEFRIFKGGSVWRPPPMNPYLQGTSEEEEESEEKAAPVPEQPKRGMLSNAQRDRLEDMLRNLSLDKLKIGECMVFCIDHAESADEVCECIAESLSILHTPMPKKISRLYLVSDILHNCSVKIANASFYRKGFQSKLEEVFLNLREAHAQIEGRLKAEAIKQKVMRVFRAWEDWAIYPTDFLIRLQNMFLGLQSSAEEIKEDVRPPPEVIKPVDSDVDGMPLEDLDGAPLDVDGAPMDDNDDLDGMPLDGSALLRAAKSADGDIDGIPLMDEIGRGQSPLLKFAPSKWESVDPAEVQAQAITTSKWELFEVPGADEDEKEIEKEDVDGMPMIEDDTGSPAIMDWSNRDSPANLYGTPTSREEMSEDKRTMLRELETKVMMYQDELESGARPPKPGYSIGEQVERYRKKLLHKAEKEFRQARERVSLGLSGALERKDKSYLTPRIEPPEEGEYRHSRKRSKSRSRSPRRRSKKHRSDSRSPKYARYSRDSRSPMDLMGRRGRSRSRSRSRSPIRKHKKKSKH